MSRANIVLLVALSMPIANALATADIPSLEEIPSYVACEIEDLGEIGDTDVAPPEAELALERSTIDTAAWSGIDARIAIAADGTMLVAHKRLVDVAPNADYATAHLVVLRSLDGGATWDERVVDDDASESTWLVARDVGFALAPDGVVYLAYGSLWGPGVLETELRIARSLDGGATWTRIATLPPGTGAHADISVLADGTLRVGTTIGIDAGFFQQEVPGAATSTDGGATWTIEELAVPIEAGASGLSIASDADGRSYIAYYDPQSTTEAPHALSVSHGAPGAWTRTAVARGCGYDGIGAAIVSPAPGEAVASYFNWSSYGTLEISRTSDGGASWQNVVVEEDRQPTPTTSVTPSYPTAIDAASGGRLALAYILTTITNDEPTGLLGKMSEVTRVALSEDGGAGWRALSIAHSPPRGAYHDVAFAPDGSLALVVQVGADESSGLELLRLTQPAATQTATHYERNATLDVSLGTPGPSDVHAYVLDLAPGDRVRASLAWDPALLTDLDLRVQDQSDPACMILPTPDAVCLAGLQASCPSEPSAPDLTSGQDGTSFVADADAYYNLLVWPALSRPQDIRYHIAIDAEGDGARILGPFAIRYLTGRAVCKVDLPAALE